MKKLLTFFVLLLSSLVLLCGCGSGKAATPTISVSIAPATQTSIDEGQALIFTATLSNDSSNKGVTWSMSGTNCTGSACGTLTNVTATAATYNAPTPLPATITVTIKATSVADATKSMSSTVTVAAAPKITTTTLASGMVGTAYSATLQASGGAGTLAWSLVSGSSLPAGLSLASSGTISGTPNAPGTTSFTVKLTDSSGAQVLSATQQLSLTIKPAVLTVTTTSLPNGVVGVAYSSSVAASGGTGSISWSVSAGSLPGGLTLSASGSFSGTPTANGSFPFTLTVTDSSSPPQTASQPLSITINPKLVITTTSLANGLVSKAYSASLQSTGGAGAISWTISSGSLPAGLSLSGASISGTPTTAGVSNFTVTAKDSSSPQQSAQQALSITITAGLAITTTSLPNGTVNSTYSATLQSSGGVAPVTWSISQGSLPAGLVLSGTGNISGSPTTAGTSNFTVKATDSSTPVLTQTQQLNIIVSPALSITTTSLPAGTVATAYSQNIETSGGTLPISWSVTSGSLPAGLALAGNSVGEGVISGTPTASGSSTFKVSAKDSSTPPVTVSGQFTLIVNAPPIIITTTSLPNGRAGAAYSAPLQASGGTPPYTWTVASGSTLPNWLTLSGSGTAWKLSGTPTAAAAATFTLTVTDSSVPNQSQNVTLTLTVVSAAACGTGHESVMKGQFAFVLRGITADGFLGAIGSFTADGNGNITAGHVDANSATISGNGVGSQSGDINPTGSSYSVGSDNRGCATIVTPFFTFITRIAISPSPAGAAQGTMIELDPDPQTLIASGQIYQQQIPAGVPTGNWVHTQVGSIQTTNYSSALKSAGVDVFGSGGAITNGEYDFQTYYALTHQTGVTGTYTAPEPTTGRFTFTTVETLGTLTGKSLNRAAYLVSGTHMLEITSTAGSALVGDMWLQSGALSLSGNLATYGSAMNSEVAGFGIMNANGSSYTANIYQDNAGTWATPAPVPTTCSYTIDSLGRVATSGTSCGSAYNPSTSTWSAPPVIYLTGPSTGFLEGSDGIWTVVPQSAISIAEGNYYFGMQFPWLGSVYESSSGVATIASDGSLTATDDTNNQADMTVNATLSVNSDGTFSTSTKPGVIVGLVVSNKQFVEVENESTVPRLTIFNIIP